MVTRPQQLEDREGGVRRPALRESQVGARSCAEGLGLQPAARIEPGDGVPDGLPPFVEQDDLFSDAGGAEGRHGPGILERADDTGQQPDDDLEHIRGAVCLPMLVLVHRGGGGLERQGPARGHVERHRLGMRGADVDTQADHVAASSGVIPIRASQSVGLEVRRQLREEMRRAGCAAGRPESHGSTQVLAAGDAHDDAGQQQITGTSGIGDLHPRDRDLPDTGAVGHEGAILAEGHDHGLDPTLAQSLHLVCQGRKWPGTMSLQGRITGVSCLDEAEQLVAVALHHPRSPADGHAGRSARGCR